MACWRVTYPAPSLCKITKHQGATIIEDEMEFADYTVSYCLLFFETPLCFNPQDTTDDFEEQNAPKSITTLHNLARTVSGIRSCYTKIVCQIYSNTRKTYPPKKSPKLAPKPTFPRAALPRVMLP